MSIFCFPRINVKGLIAVNVGTANNDDYSGDRFPPGSPYAGEPLRQADTKSVQAITYGMTDEEHVAWMQKVSFYVPPPQLDGAAPAVARTTRSEHAEPVGGGSRGTVEGAAAAASAAAEKRVPRIPGEWNYYGDMGLTMMGVKVVAVQSGDRPQSGADASELVGAELSFKAGPGSGGSKAMLIDVNPEDSPCSQVFSDALTLELDGKALFSGKPSKAVTRWINFQRNTNLAGPNGAGGAFQCVVPLAQLTGQPILDYLPPQGPGGEKLAGLVFRYYLYRPLQTINTFAYPDQKWYDAMVELYTKQGTNPDYLELVGTLAPWFEGEMRSVPTGRLLNQTGSTFPIPPGEMGNAPPFALAPAILHAGKERISVDFSGAFPDRYQGSFDPLQTADNAKYDFGKVSLVLRAGGRDHRIGAVDYQDTAAGDARGWIFDFPLQGVAPADLEAGEFAVVLHAEEGDADLLKELDYLIASDQSGLFGEQILPKDGEPQLASRFLNESAAEEPATIRVFRKGKELSAADCPPITVWAYDTTPNQTPGTLERLSTDFKPGDPLTVDVGEPGNRLFTFTVPGQEPPPKEYQKLDTTAILPVSLRILPNDRDYSRYYQDPDAAQPIGNDKLTYEVLFAEVLRNYYLLYPAMSQVVPLDQPQQWENPQMAALLLERTSRALWDHYGYMPRTRDLSASRRRLIHAWCLRYLKTARAATGSAS
jgi:hypothetical protein